MVLFCNGGGVQLLIDELIDCPPASRQPFCSFTKRDTLVQLSVLVLEAHVDEEGIWQLLFRLSTFVHSTALLSVRRTDV